MSNFKEKLLTELSSKEIDINIYNDFVNNPVNPEEDRKVVSFKLFYEMIAFRTLWDLVPEDYTAAETTAFTVSTGLKGVTGFVSVVDGKVKISTEYKDLLARKEEYLKAKKD
jgi:hypothetical protein